MVIIDWSKAYMTGSSNDECERRQQVDSIVWYLVSPLLSQHESPAQHPSSAQGNGKHGNLSCLSPQSLSLSSLSVCVCKLNTIVPFHQVLVSATHLKKKTQNRILATIVQETHCVDSRHFSCKLLKSPGCNVATSHLFLSREKLSSSSFAITAALSTHTLSITHSWTQDTQAKSLSVLRNAVS